ncbi:Uncharacterised protein [Mycobacteroides abscessus subsp. abscessus]|nr:Uncharacterised protein [Mycobacteroides abscessus subsp. abscessus]
MKQPGCAEPCLRAPRGLAKYWAGAGSTCPRSCGGAEPPDSLFQPWKGISMTVRELRGIAIGGQLRSCQRCWEKSHG